MIRYATLFLFLISGCRAGIPEGRFQCTGGCPPGWFCGVDSLCYSFESDAGRTADAGVVDTVPDAGSDVGGDVPPVRGRYWLLTDVSTWDEARTTCRAEGGDLVAVGSDDEQAVAWFFAMDAGMPVWLGATDDGSEGMWRWSTGETWTPRWGATQPDNAGGAEHCAVFWPGFGGAWADVDCESSFPALCESFE